MSDLQTRVVAAAIEARQRAYAPYSKYAVGAALATASQQIFAGCNVENASYGLTVCAERVAVTRAVAEGQQQFALLVVITENAAGPCGACLQVLSEFCDDLPILLADATAARITETSLRTFLPVAFRSAKLGRPSR